MYFNLKYIHLLLLVATSFNQLHVAAEINIKLKENARYNNI